MPRMMLQLSLKNRCILSAVNEVEVILNRLLPRPAHHLPRHHLVATEVRAHLPHHLRFT